MRFGLVGTGYWARATHAVALSRSPLVEFVGVWGRDPVRAAELGEEFAVHSFPDLDSMFGEVDAVAFAVPPDVQGELATRAAKAGKHLLLEKPISVSPLVARQLEASVVEAGVATIVFFALRFNEAHREWLASLEGTEGWRGGSVLWLTQTLSSDGPYSGSAWRRQKGALWDVGPHTLSVLSAVLGGVVGISAEQGVGDLVHLVLRHEGGATSTASLTLRAPLEKRFLEVMLWGSAGVTTMPPLPVSSEAALCRALEELVESAAAPGHGHPCDVHFGRQVVELLAQAESSMTNAGGN